MKVLHIWNTAGVASILSRELNKNGIQSEVVMRKSHDPFLFTEYYGDELLDYPAPKWIDYVIEKAKDFDILHVHSAVSIIERLKAEYPDKKIVMHHHGTDLTKTNFKVLKKIYKLVDQVIVCSPDLFGFISLMGQKSHLILNAVDTELFKPNPTNDGSLYISMRYIDTEPAIELIKSYIKEEPFIYDREVYPLNYIDMPVLLNRFSLYCDIKCPPWLCGEPVHATSKTALEALSCGLKVLTYSGDIIEGLPEQNTPEYQCKKVIDVYRLLE